MYPPPCSRCPPPCRRSVSFENDKKQQKQEGGALTAAREVVVILVIVVIVVVVVMIMIKVATRAPEPRLQLCTWRTAQRERRPLREQAP